MERRTLLLISWCLGDLVVNAFAAEPAIDLALRAIKMTEHDLSFSKTNVDSELIFPEARSFLQQPLALPAFADTTLARLRAATNFVTLSEAKGLTHSTNDPIQIIVNAARSIRPLLPKPNKPALDAFILETMHDSRAELDVDPELLRRDDALGLQDCELADAILAASDHFDREALLRAFRTLTAAIDAAIPILQSNQLAESETDTDLGMIIIGGTGKNVYTNDAFLIIDYGGDDIYSNSAGGAYGSISIVIDLAGNDQYISRKSFSQGSGVFGIGILVDCGGDDSL